MGNGTTTHAMPGTPSRGGEKVAEVTKGKARDRLTEIFVKHRWAVVVPIVLPLSKLYAVYWRARHVIVRELLQESRGHDARVAKVVAQIRAWNAAGRRGLLCTSRTLASTYPCSVRSSR